MLTGIGITWSIAHDPAVYMVLMESEELAEFLANEARLISCRDCGEAIRD
jgi:hypothetical protein